MNTTGRERRTLKTRIDRRQEQDVREADGEGSFKEMRRSRSLSSKAGDDEQLASRAI
jgi:hypothetical protein